MRCFVIFVTAVYVLLLGLPYAESPSQKMQQISSPKGGVMVPGVPRVHRGNWGRERDIARS